MSVTMEVDGESQPFGSGNTKPWQTWTTEQVVAYLTEQGIQTNVIQILEDEGVTGRHLSDLTEEALEKFGLNFGQRKDLMETLSDLGVFYEEQDFFSFKIFNDSIHGHIELHPLCIKIIDTPQFQRLRNLKQLGGCYFLYPGAAHNRFEHSIGTSHLAERMATMLQQRQRELKVTKTDILSVTIAGLCHDLGHGPFSHMFDGHFIKEAAPGRNWKHEDASVMMFDHMMEVNELAPEFAKHGLSDQDQIFIKELIRGPLQIGASGEWPYKGRGKEKNFLYEIVANKRTGIDVDKWDYFARDCHMLGIRNNFDHQRLMKLVRVIKVEGLPQICVRDKEIGNVYDMFHLRSVLHRRAYQHKVTHAVEALLTDVLLRADKYITFPGKDERQVTISECIDDPKAFTLLDDRVLTRIEVSTITELAESRALLRRLHTRQLYVCAGQSQPEPDIPETKASVRQEIVQCLTDEELNGSPRLSPDDIAVKALKVDYGMKDKNPVDNVRFYKKNDPNNAFQVRKDQVSTMLPEKFAEQIIRVYCKKTDEESVETATKCFQRWCEKRKLTFKVNELTPVVKTGRDAPNSGVLGKRRRLDM